MLDLSAHPLVETAWLAEHLSHEHVRVVDARWRGDGTSRALYRQGHLPGAVHVDWQQDLSYTDERGVGYLLLGSDRFATVMESAGIGDETCVIAYADMDYSGAARLWWALRLYGHEQVAILNGGWDRWIAEGWPVSGDEPRPSRSRFTPNMHPNLLATSSEIKSALAEAESKVRLVDTRPAEQFAGLAIWTPLGSLFLPQGQSEIALTDLRVMRGGHIPGAVHLHASRFLDPVDWIYLPPTILGAMLREAGLQPEQRIITYCGSGISASLGLFALHLAGFPDVALYDASWEEWGTDPTFPVERA